jgi:hypothetical protein
MNVPAKIAGLVLGLAAVFGAALGIGTAVGPVGPAPATAPAAAGNGHGGSGHGGSGHPDSGHADGAAVPADAAQELPAGLMTTQDGYTLAPARRTQAAGGATPVEFRILGPGGEPVTAYEETHDQDLHLIAVRRDLSGFQHVHPELEPDGTWHAPLALTAGTWRLFADFTPTGHPGLTLGTDVAVAGEHVPAPLPPPSRTAEVDGYTVSLDGDLTPGAESELTLTVTRDGRPVADLQPHLAAYGHLVVLRDGDLAYLHVHPVGEPGDGVTPAGPGITFHATAPSAGTYRLFLDFRHGNAVRTAEFTVEAGGAAAVPADTGGHPHDGAVPHGPGD